MDTESAEIIFVDFQKLNQIFTNHSQVKEDLEDFCNNADLDHYNICVEKSELKNFQTKNIEKHLPKKLKIPARERLHRVFISDYIP